MQGSQFYLHFPLSGANTDQETNQINIFCLIIRGIIPFNIFALKGYDVHLKKKTKLKPQYNITSDTMIHLLGCIGNLLLKSDFSFVPLQVFITFDPL